jgi:hypothetical protein
MCFIEKLADGIRWIVGIAQGYQRNLTEHLEGDDNRVILFEHQVWSLSGLAMAYCLEGAASGSIRMFPQMIAQSKL